MRTRITLTWLVALLLTACAAPTPQVIKETVIVMQTPWPTYTPIQTYTPYPTYTPQDALPTYTPAATYTPHPTYTVPPTPTRTPTATPTHTPAATPTPTPTPTPKPPFVIRDPAFQAKPGDTCEKLDIEITDIQGDRISLTFRAGSEIPMSVPLLQCSGGKHTWKGQLTYKGYTFASDENDPLQFRVEEAGYVYVKGKGTVTFPDGTAVTLPR
jgi:hypothetical protein